MTPKEKAKHLFNTIKYVDNESGKDCATCDCVVLPIAKFICDEFIKFICDEFINEHGYDGRLQSQQYWQDVKSELERL